MKIANFRTAIATIALLSVTASLSAAQQPQTQQDPGAGQGRRMRGFGGYPGGGGGVLGTVTDVTNEHYTIKTESGDIYTVHYSVNTRIMKQPPTPPGSQSRRGSGSGSSNGAGTGEGSENRTPPQPIKPTEIKVGDVITAGGEVDQAGKSIGAVFIMQLDPERAKQMREMEANYGKTWLAGRITSIDGTTIKIEGMVDHAPHSIEVDENTSFRQRRDSITLADIQPGQQLRAEGAVKNGVFLATVVNAVQPREPGAAPNGANVPPPTTPKQ
jgi:hypothetical protein